MVRVALLYPKSPGLRVTEMMGRAMTVYNRSVSILYERGSAEMGIRIRMSPIHGYIVSEGLLTLGAIALREGHHVKYFEEKYLEDHFDYAGKIRDIAAGFELVGMTVLTVNYPHVVKLMRTLKRHNPSLLVILGGPHVTYLDEQAILDGADIVVRGEGEITFKELLERIEGRRQWDDVLGITFRDGYSVRRNPDREEQCCLDDLPPPAFELIPEAMRSRASVSLTTSRGCVSACRFCVEGSYWKGLRFKSPTTIVRDLHKYQKVFPFNHALIFDSTFTYPRARALEIGEVLAKTLPDMFFSCNARADTIDEVLVERLSNCNFVGVYFGAESGSDEILAKAKKGQSYEELRDAVKIASDRVPFCLVTFMIGNPGESLETAHRTIKAAKDLFDGTDVFQVNTRLYTPYPGTPMWDRPEYYDFEILTRDFARYSRYDYPPVVRTRELSQFLIWALFLESYLTCTLELARRADIEQQATEILEGMPCKEVEYSLTKPYAGVSSSVE